VAGEIDRGPVVSGPYLMEKFNEATGV
jgi:hypothetical protein